MSKIYALINGICSGFGSNCLNIYLNTIENFGKSNPSLGLCNTSYFEIGDKYSPNLQHLVKNEVVTYVSYNHVVMSTRATYRHVFIFKMGIWNPTTNFYQFFNDKSN